MDLRGIVTILLIVGAVFLAAWLLIRYRFWSWEFWAGGAAILIVAWLTLVFLNRVAIKPIRTEADGIIGQFQSLGNQALPALIPSTSSEGVNVYVAPPPPAPPAPAPAASDTGGGPTADADQSGQTPQSVIPQVPAEPLQKGDVRWGGNLFPQTSDSQIPFQVECFKGSPVITFMQYGVPYGVTTSTAPKNGAWATFQSEGAEIWNVTVTYPYPGMPTFSYETSGIIARSLKKQWGSAVTTGTSMWPLVQQEFDGKNWNTATNPVICKWP